MKTNLGEVFKEKLELNFSFYTGHTLPTSFPCLMEKFHHKTKSGRFRREVSLSSVLANEEIVGIEERVCNIRLLHI